MKNKKRLRSDIEVLSVVAKSDDVREVLKKLEYETQPSTFEYERVSRLMILNGIRFKNGGCYVHPKCRELYEKHKEDKPKITFG